MIFEVLSPSTSSFDHKVKLAEYRGLSGVEEVVLVGTASMRIRLVRRDREDDWTERLLDVGVDLPLASLSLTIPHAEIFARD